MKKGIVVAGVILVLVIVLRPFVLDFVELLNFNREIEAIEIQNVRFVEIEDGVYEGSHQVGSISASVRISFTDGEMELLDIEHEHERGYNAEEIVERVIEERSLRVDAVTGATDSSRVILKAIENAICQGNATVCEN